MAGRLIDALFLCTGNPARSIMAEAILARAGAGRFRAHGAGSLPAGEVHPRAVELLERLGRPVAGPRSGSRDELAAAGAPDPDFVFTVCDDAASEACPVRPGPPTTAHRGVPDPAAATGNEAEAAAAFADACRTRNHRIGIFVNPPPASLDELALREGLDEIGGRTPDARA